MTNHSPIDAETRQEYASSPHHLCRQFLLEGVKENQRILDVGCGDGELMVQLACRCGSVTGVEIDRSLVEFCCERGLDVREGCAEALPFPDQTFDMIVCSVVLPYTDERQAASEWARVLKPGGVVNMTCHGFGYGLACLFEGRGAKRRFYGIRMMINTLYYRLTGRRLPLFLGDTLCQTTGQLKAYYRVCGLALERELAVGRFAGAPRFLCHRIIKPI